MFGSDKKKQAKIIALEARFAALATKVEHNNHEIAELKSEVGRLEDLGKKVSELQTRQVILRTALSDAVEKI